MSDKLGIHPLFPVQVDLEGEDHKHLVHDPLHGFHARTMPRPNLGTDVIDDLYAVPFRNFGEPEVEARVIDQQHDVRFSELQERFECLLHRTNDRNMLEDLDKSHEPQLVDMVNEVHALLLHPVSPHAEDIDLRIATFQLTNDPGAVKVS